jgi:hypothetical protein
MFRMIGKFDIRRDGDFVRVWSAPEFNIEAAQQYTADMLRMIQEMPSTFGTLVTFESPPIVGPDVEEAMHVSARHRGERGMVAAAFITANLDALMIARGQWDRIYAGTGIVYRFFTEEAPARAWLQEQIDQARVRRAREEG